MGQFLYLFDGPSLWAFLDFHVKSKILRFPLTEKGISYC